MTYAHLACHAGETGTTAVIGLLLVILLFRPRRTSMRSSWARVGGVAFLVVLAGAVTFAGCSSNNPTARPTTKARIEIVAPQPHAATTGTPTLDLRVLGGKIVPAATTKVSGALPSDQGHIHLFVDRQLVQMTGQLTSEIHAPNGGPLSPGPHVITAEFVAIDHGPFKNRTVASVPIEVQA